MKGLHGLITAHTRNNKRKQHEMIEVEGSEDEDSRAKKQKENIKNHGNVKTSILSDMEEEA